MMSSGDHVFNIMAWTVFVEGHSKNLYTKSSLNQISDSEKKNVKVLEFFSLSDAAATKVL